MNKMRKGFTLIELLVVIAIIGILSSVVLASLNTARAKGADAAIKSQLASVRAQAEILYDTNQCYSTGVCNGTTPAVVAPADCTTGGHAVAASIFIDAKIWSMINGSITTSGGMSACSAPVGGSAWAVAVELKNDNTKAWCVDSAGTSKQSTAVITPGTQASINGAVTALGLCL